MYLANTVPCCRLPPLLYSNIIAIAAVALQTYSTNTAIPRIALVRHLVLFGGVAIPDIIEPSSLDLFSIIPGKSTLSPWRGIYQFLHSHAVDIISNRTDQQLRLF